MGLSGKPRILFVRDPDHRQAGAPQSLTETFDVVEAHSPLHALSQLTSEEFAGVYIDTRHLHEALRIGQLLQHDRTLDAMPDGVALLDTENTIVWANQQMLKWADCASQNDIAGQNFYSALDTPEILGPDFCPFHTVLATGQSSSTTLRLHDNRYFQIHAAMVMTESGEPPHLIVTVRDITVESLQQQKLTAIHKAGMDLADLTPEEVFDMSIADRIELLKSNILHYTSDLLNFDVVEIRLLDQETGRLEPLLAVGIDDEAAGRELYAQPQDNGVTGFVAATGKSYLCEDTEEDPLYIEGFRGAKSSLTVPLILHDQVLGSFNVESPDPRAFTESDLQFLEIFSRDLALALNTLELLAAQSANTAQQSVEAIHSAVALPVDEILNEAVNIMEKYIGHEPEVVERLQRILRNARDIKQVIHKVGQTMTPSQAVLNVGSTADSRPRLQGRRVLVADDDESVRQHAHALLERYGCIVETAHTAGEAVYMVRNSGPDHDYECVIADIRLPDMSGYQLMLRLQSLMQPVPMVLMTGFGYDPGHSIVKARQAGLHPRGVLYKPFRLDQLLETVETVIEFAKNPPAPADNDSPAPDGDTPSPQSTPQDTPPQDTPQGNASPPGGNLPQPPAGADPSARPQSP